MKKLWALLPLLLCGCADLAQQPMQREIGDFDMTLGRSPLRSMAQGLVNTHQDGAFHGGVDLHHASGWYVGQWAANIDPLGDQTLETDTYAGFKRPLQNGLGYEVGTLLNSYPTLAQLNLEQYYAGLSIFGSRLGASFSIDPERSDQALVADLGLREQIGFDLRLRYGRHRLQTATILDSGRRMDSFGDWSVDLRREIGGFDMQLRYTGTSLEGADCSAYSGSNAYCDAYVMLQASHPLF